MRPAELAIGGDDAFFGGHVSDVLGRVDRQALAHLLFRAGAAELHRLRLEDPRPFLVEQPDQQVRRCHARPDQLELIHRIEQHVGAGPVLALVLVEDVGGLKKPLLARAALGGRGEGRSLGHLLQHHAASAPAFAAAWLGGFAEGQREPRRQLLGLREIGLGAGGQRVAGDRRDALIGRHALPLIDQDREIALADQRRGLGPFVETVLVEAGPGADTGRGALLGGGVVIGGDQPRRPVAAHLKRQLPAQLHGLADQRGEKGHLGHQRLDLRGVVVLLQHPVEHAVETRDPAPDVGLVELEGQDGVVPGNAGAEAHGVSLRVGDGHTATI